MSGRRDFLCIDKGEGILFTDDRTTWVISFYAFTRITGLAREDSLILTRIESSELRAIRDGAVSCVGEYLCWCDAEHLREDITK